MAILHFRSIERRRTARAAISVNVVAYGEKESGEKFKFWARTVSVSAHGGVVALNAELDAGQIFTLRNEFNMRKAVGRVVSVRRDREGQVQAAFEFVEDGEKFWSMVFPAAGAKPLRRLLPRQPEAVGK